MRAKITILDGDGIGAEVAAAGESILQHVAKINKHEFVVQHELIGGISIDETGSPLTDGAIEECLESDAVLLGAVGGPKWDDPKAPVRPEQGLLKLRKALAVYANLRPVKPYPALLSASPLKSELLKKVDLVVVRELTGGIYFGAKTRDSHSASDLCVYEKYEIERIVRVAAKLAQQRSGRLCSVDKANILETSRLWRDTTCEIMANEFPDVALEHMLVDAAAMHLLRKPAHFDVIVTENMFGDILTDEASMLTGSMGMLPSASLGDSTRGLYEPIHGSAPDIAGKGIANPCAMIASIAMMLRQSLDLHGEANRLEQALIKAIETGARTSDIAVRGEKVLGTTEMTNAIISAY